MNTAQALSAASRRLAGPPPGEDHRHDGELIDAGTDRTRARHHHAGDVGWVERSENPSIATETA